MFPSQAHIDAAVSSGDYWFGRTGVYSFPSFRLAQTAIESANGTALSGENNYWGVKANKEQIAAGQFKLCRTREVLGGKSVYIYDKFASYASLTAGYIAQAKLLVTSPYYEKSRHAKNPRQYAIDVAVHYATDPNYARVIIHLMDSKNLYRFDAPDHVAAFTHDNGQLQPPLHEQRKARAPAAAAAGVAAPAAAAPASGQWSPAALAIAAVVVALLVALVVRQRRRADAVLTQILTPPPPEMLPPETASQGAAA